MDEGSGSEVTGTLPAPRERTDTLPLELPERTLGYHAAAWMMDNLIQPNGPKAGQPFIPTDRQIEFLAHFYALTHKGSFVYRQGIRRLSKGSGKGVTLVTPIITPQGWRKFGDLRPGDYVFHPSGKPTMVTKTHPIDQWDTWEVELSDGTVETFTGEHLFTVEEFVGKSKRVRRTLDVRTMAREGLVFERPLTKGSTKATKAGVGKFALPETEPLEFPERDLPVDPWVLGYWLGDGSTGQGSITCDVDDLPHVESRMRAAGYDIGAVRAKREGGRGRSVGVLKLAADLRRAGVLNDKHIPDAYLYSSVEQRRALIQGLMDSDGYIQKNGAAEYCQVRKQIADGMAFLLRSMGVKVNVRESEAKLYGRVTGPRYRLTFKPYKHQNLVTLPRRAERVQERRRKPIPRVIKDVRRVTPVDARCITVEAEDGLYLVGETMVVTHNSPFAAAMCLFELLGPCRYDGFDRHEPFGVRAKPMSMPLVQIVATSESQPLALDTKVPTTGGWSTVGDLEVGDMVYGSDGNPTPVLGKTEVFTDHDCYQIAFDDGTTVVADAAHGWTLERLHSHGDRFETVTMSTQDMRDYLNSGRRRSLRIPLVDRKGGASAPTLISPYMLGYWLGDGDRGGSTIAIDWRRKDEIEGIFNGELGWWDDIKADLQKNNGGRLYIRRRRQMCPRGHSYAEGDPNRAISSSGHPMCRRCNKGAREGMMDKKLLSFRERLREVGVLGNKHVPEAYLRASYEDRLALLQGLIDSDGTVTKKGNVRFTNTNPRILNAFVELAESLGQKCFTFDGDAGSKVVAFTPQPGFPAARLTCHAERLPQESRTLSAYRRIESVEPVRSVPVQCVTIGTEDHLFQVEGGVLTHNTANTIRMVRAFCQKKGPLARKYDLEVAKTFIETPSGGKLQQMTSSAHSMEGGEVSFVVGDELEHWLPAQGGPAMLQTIQQNAAKMGGRFMGTCNAWVPGEQSSAEAVFEAWCDQEDGLTRGKTKILYDARIAPPNTVLTDEPEEGQVGLTEALEYVYEDCPWVNLESIKEQIWSPEYPESRSIRFFLNRPNAAEASWVTLEEWTQLRKPDRKVEPGEKIVMFFDGSKSNDHTALVGCCMEDGHIFKIGHWKPEKPLGVVNVAAVDAGVRRAFDTYNVVAFWADVREWESFTRTAWPEDFGDRLIVPAVRGGMSASPIAWDMRSHAYQFAEAAETAFTEIQQQAFTHDGDSALGEHVSNCRVNEFKGRWSVKKESPKSSKKIDLAVCMIGARMLYRYVKSSKEWADMNRPVGAWTVIV